MVILPCTIFQIYVNIAQSTYVQTIVSQVIFVSLYHCFAYHIKKKKKKLHTWYIFFYLIPYQDTSNNREYFSQESD